MYNKLGLLTISFTLIRKRGGVWKGEFLHCYNFPLLPLLGYDCEGLELSGAVAAFLQPHRKSQTKKNFFKRLTKALTLWTSELPTSRFVKQMIKKINNSEQKKSATKEYILCVSIYLKFKKKQNYSVCVCMLTYNNVKEKEQAESFWGTDNVLFCFYFYLGGGYELLL